MLLKSSCYLINVLSNTLFLYFMQFLKLLKKYIIDSQIYVSLMATCWTGFFMLEQNAFQWQKAIVVFLTFLGGYIYTKYQEIDLSLTKRFLISIPVASILLFLIIQYLSKNQLFIWIFIVILGIFYNSKFLKSNARKIPFIKSFYVGIIWAIITSSFILPKFSSSIFMLTFLYITALVFSFDIRDVDIDTVLTIPKKFGIKFTKLISIILITISTCIAYVSISSAFFIFYFISMMLACCLIYCIEKKSLIHISHLG